MVVGERYRVDRDPGAEQSFRADDPETWGTGGKSPLLCFDASFGSSHGIVFAGSGGFKTTSVTVPNSASMGQRPGRPRPLQQGAHRWSGDTGTRRAGRCACSTRDPRRSASMCSTGSASTALQKEEDIAAVASWIITNNPRLGSARDDFFRASALQLLTALIADVCLSGHTELQHQHLRQVRAEFVRTGAEAAPAAAVDLRQLRLRIRARERRALYRHDPGNLQLRLCRMRSRKPTGFPMATMRRWSLDRASQRPSSRKAPEHERLHQPRPEDVGESSGLRPDHHGWSQRDLQSQRRHTRSTLPLFDEVARLGYFRVETARDAGRKYGITLLMLYQSIRPNARGLWRP